MGKYFKWVLIGSFALLFIVYAFGINLSQQDAPTSTERERNRNPHGDDSATDPYMQEVHPYIQRTVESLEKISKVSDEVVDEKTNPEEAAKQVRTEYSELTKIKSEVQKIDAPQNMAGFHEHYLKGLDYYIEGADIYADALEKKNPKQVDEASELFDKGNQELEKASQELKDDQRMKVEISMPGLNRPSFSR